MRKLFLLVVVVWIFCLTCLFIDSRRECRGQCFQTHDKGCQERCADKGLCPMAGGDQ